MTEYTSFDIAHIGNVELLTPKFDESLWFFRDLLAMRVVAEAGDSVYLRTWDEYQRYTIKLTASDAAGVGRTTFRATSQEALERRVAAIEATGLGEGWVDGEVGHRPDLPVPRPRRPLDGHLLRDRAVRRHRRQAGAEEPGIRVPRPRGQRAPPRPHQLPREGRRGQRRVHRRRPSAAARASGSRLDAGGYAAWWFHFNNKSYDVVYSDDWTKHGNRLHHIAFAPDTREDILKAADIFLENGIYIESGPHKHAINQTFFLYVWEPGGNRIEFANAGARLLLDPDSARRGVDARRSARRARPGA